ncbi:hypothetical protein [Tenacibaculum aestuariivivum]|uniref:hypothetical protein n=1 Tax=Tenacibaculum aestuariivivum TaxID=2006131 RepID=UPI003AB8A772
MNKLLSIVLSLIIVFQSFGISFHDFSKIGEFIEHAQFHNKEYGDNVFTFISKHYGKLKINHNQEHQEQQEDHQKLPFNNNCTHLFLLTAIIDSSITNVFKRVCFLSLNKPNFFYKTPISSVFKVKILQPPRYS